MLRVCLLAFSLLSSVSLAQDKKEPPKLDNESISDFVDNPTKYKGKTLTLQVTYIETSTTLDMQGGEKGIPFTAIDPNNKAKLVLAVDIPKGFKAPAARKGEDVVVTFKCNEGATGKGNVAVTITRPVKAKP